jgi:glycosyltransferase involved in cell wall biosynthesis
VNRKPRTLGNGDVWVVIPAFNEAPVLAGVLRDLSPTGCQLVVVDDGSADGTFDAALWAGAAVVRHPVNLGQGAALQTGLSFALRAGAEIIVTYDADGQHRVDDIQKLLNALRSSGADFALGSRFLAGHAEMPFTRRLLLRAAIWLTRLTAGLRLTDTHNGLRAMTRRGAQTIKLRQNRMAHASEILDQIAASGLRYVEVPVTIDYTSYSLGKGQKSTAAFDILIDMFGRALVR